jgi:subtilisin family serine protease
MTATRSMGDTRGTGIVLADCEYGYVEGHEDLCGVMLEEGQTIHPTVRSLGWDEHGTATLGEIMSIDNGYGCTGLAPDTQGTFFTEWSVEEGSRRLTAITNAIASVNAGDIVMLEMQANGPGGGYCPAEIDPAVWTVVRAGADGGVIVVAAAGNGNQDLDSGPYAEYRSRGDSGSIIVGAGSPDTSHNKLSFSTFGARVNVQGWGSSVFSLGYGDFAQHGGQKEQRYTSQFSGTSSATPFIAGSCAGMQSLAVEQLGRRLTPLEMRELLISTGLDQGSGGHIGPFPNLVEAAQQIIDQSNRMSLFVGPLIGGENGAFQIDDAMPNQRAYLIYSLAGRGSTYVSQLNVTLDLRAPILARTGRTDANGFISWSVPIPLAGSGRTVWFQAAQYETTSAVVESEIE